MKRGIIGFIIGVFIATTATAYAAPVKQFVLTMASYPIVLNGHVFSDVAHPPLTYKGTTYVPLKDAAQLLGASVKWNKLKKEVDIARSVTEKRPEETPHNKFSATVIRVVDGDTLHVNIQGRDIDIRLLMVDSPEDVKPGTPIEPFGPTAASYAKQLLTPGKQVQIETDTTMKGKYGRLLCYLWVDGKMYNELLLQKGYARVAYVESPNTKYESVFKSMEVKAKSAKLGIWQIDGYVTDNGFDTTIAKKWDDAGKPHYPGMIATGHSTPEKTTSTPVQSKNGTSNSTVSNLNQTDSPGTCANPDIKGNISSGTRIYHLPGDPWYSRTTPEEMFCTVKDAQAAGFRAPK